MATTKTLLQILILFAILALNGNCRPKNSHANVTLRERSRSDYEYCLRQLEAYASSLNCSKCIDGIDPGCPRCGHPECSFQHMLWQCSLYESPSTEMDLNCLLTSHNKGDQLRAIQKDLDIAVEFKLTVPSLEWPNGVAPFGGLSATSGY